MSETVLQRVARGEMAAMQECIDTYGGLIWSLARRFCPDAAEAEDAVQEAFIALWENAVRFDPERGAEATFVSMISRRRLIDRGRSRQRARKRIEKLADMTGDRIEHPSERPVDIEEAQRARQAIEDLSDGQRQVLQLAIHGGYTHEEIAEIADLPLGTVKTHARRGLIRVREALAEKRAQAEAGTKS